jgi:hypothetical protein
VAEYGAMSHTSATELDEQLFQAALQSADPVTVRFCGVKDVTLPTYIVYQVAGIVLMLFLIVVAAEIVTPTTMLGDRVSNYFWGEPVLLDIAIWTPPGLLSVLILEVIESTIVYSAFRRKLTERDDLVRQQLTPTLTS